MIMGNRREDARDVLKNALRRSLSIDLHRLDLTMS